MLLAEVGTCQMEFIALARNGGPRALREKAEHVFDLLDRNGPALDAEGSRLWAPTEPNPNPDPNPNPNR